MKDDLYWRRGLFYGARKLYSGGVNEKVKGYGTRKFHSIRLKMFLGCFLFIDAAEINGHRDRRLKCQTFITRFHDTGKS